MIVVETAAEAMPGGTVLLPDTAMPVDTTTGAGGEPGDTVSPSDSSAARPDTATVRGP